MLSFGSTFITSFTLDYLVVNWTIKPTVEDVNLYQFSVFRSNSPDGEYIKAVDSLVDRYFWKDTSVTLKTEWRKYWYKVKVELISDPNQFSETEPFTTGNEPDPIALEIIRRNDIILNSDEFVGRSAFLLVRKTFGQRCTDCWDPLTQRKEKSDCPICWNTGFVGGYFEPILIRINIRPEIEKNAMRMFEWAPNQVSAWMSSFPLASPADVIIEDSNKRWRVVNIQKTEKRRVVLHQELQLTSVNLNDIEYKFPVPNQAQL